MQRNEESRGNKMITYKIGDVDDARFVAELVGFVPSNQGQRGAFPIRQLAEFLARHGHQLDTSEYVSSATTKVDPSYWVGIPVKVDQDADGNAVVAPKYAQISLSEVRELTGLTGRGKPGHGAIVEAVVRREHWTPVGSKSSFKVTKLT